MKDFFSFIISPEIQSKISPLKILFLIFSSILFGFIIWAQRKIKLMRRDFFRDLKEFKSSRALEALEFVKKWEKVKKRLKKGWEAEAKLAIIEADKLFDELLKRMGYTGESLGERLKKLDKNLLPNIDDIWEAHKIRNNIVHDPDYKLSLERAKEVIKIYEEALKNLEAI